MSKSDRMDNSVGGPRMSRRLFVRNMAGAFAAALAGSNLLEGCSPSTATLSPTNAEQPPLATAMKQPAIRTSFVCDSCIRDPLAVGIR